ncbi:amino acid adenylation enzyme/thioester reductase family protein [Frankia torreyi]|uniref:Amino acid adenylation enzyme/thioester reductase family protein n=3 Tax=Frankia TaxID=1854 RepID=A0A0D8BG44_9ACTN|nr:MULTISPECIES: non-ribosomal peptide synthetase [Frankia]KJE23035.1 amino acid adenylation enzyme/thioester reductase family protein [Frankia torreyi]
MADLADLTDAAGLSERLAALSPEKRARFEELLAQSGRSENTFPLSVLQQGIWFLEQIRPGNPAYVVPAAAHLRGPLDVRALRDALAETVRRHEALRTTFGLRDGRPAQIVHPRMSIDLPEVELGDDPLEARIAEELAGPFDLATGPLLRLRLLRIGPEEYVLAAALHHLVADGWSVGILLSELSVLYAAFVAGRPSPLVDLEIQYGDFAVWQQQETRAENLEADLEYWRGQLAGAPDFLALATDRPRPAVQGFDGASVPFELPEPLMRGLGELGRRHGATVYMVLLACFQVLLHRYSDQDDIVVGVPMAGRERAEVEPLIGFFVNTLPVRADLGGNPAFVAALERVRDACLGAYAHQAIPFEKIVSDLRPPRDLSRPPIFQVGLSYQSDPMPRLAVAGVEFARVPLQARGARFDLELQFFDNAGGLRGWFEYDRDLFDEATIVRMAGHLRRVVEQVAARPQTPVDDLELLDDDERRHLLVHLNDTGRDWPGAGLIHECFEEQVGRTPRATALVFEGQSLDYAELNRRANRLAHRLRRLGVGRDVLVGVAMERSPELVVGLLAILKAGGAYVPLDPGYPRERLRYMLEDAAVPVLLTQRAVLDRLPPVRAETLCVEELQQELRAEPDHDPGVAVGGEDLAYVIYTSGSTGRPKGVMNVHAAIRNRLLWMQDAYGLDTADRVLQKTPFSFDVSVWEFFWPLMTGATLVVARPDGHRDSRYLVETIRDQGITTLHFVPSMLQVFLREPDVAQCTGLRRVICSGEALPRDLQDRFLERSGAELHNLYGPTEAAVDVTAWACERDDDPRPVPIGFPIANTRIHVLDRRLRPVPVGVPGELHIAGRNLARGYLGRPELTAERFVEDPFDAAPGARLYRTGDLARHREDGALEYLGRLDHQIKLRGLRIELGEIEFALAGHERVREAIVVAREHGPGDTRLVAYLTAAGEPADLGPQGTGELIDHLQRRLPEYMVPSAFVVLPALPLTPNGKVDRAALPEPELDRSRVRTPFVAPREDLPRAIAALWRELLGVERVGMNDNFFDLGGHSLLMAELRTRLTAAVGRELSMVELFQHPTVGSLADHLRRPAAPRDGATDAARDHAESRRRSQIQRQQSAARRARPRNGR